MGFQIEQCLDSFELVRLLKTASADVIITDPPYSKHCQENLCSGSLVGKKQVPKYELKFDPMTEYGWLKDALRVARRWVVVFCTLEDFGKFEQVVGRPGFVRSAVWYKPNSMGQLTKDRPASAYEGIALLHSDQTKKQWNGRGSYGIWKCNGTRGKKDRHPNEKPIDLCLKLVSLFSNRGDLVLDLFSGSAAIGEASVRLGRQYVGFDNDLEWVEKGKARLAPLHADVTDEHALSLCSMRDVPVE